MQSISAACMVPRTQYLTSHRSATSYRSSLGIKRLHPSRLVVYAAPQAPEKEQKLSEQQVKRKEEIEKEFNASGPIGKQAAQRILKAWEQSGATDAKHLRSMIRRRSLSAVLGISLQLGLDVTVASGSFTLAQYLAVDAGIPLHWLWSFVAAFIGSYYALGAGFDTFTLGALITASLRFQSDSAAFVAAVRELSNAESESGLNVVDKAAKARQASKVFNALNKMSDLLKEEVGKDVGEGAGLSSLATYLLLQQAEQNGFDYKKEGLSDEEAGDIARLFGEYDTNDDDRLDQDEVYQMTTRLGTDLSREEVKDAFSLLDTDGSRYIEFPELVKLYKKQLKEPQTS